MDDKLSMVIAAAAFAFAGVRLYQKYIKKDQPGKKGETKSSHSPFGADKKSDYEPYSGKDK
jgi:hypothetical protein